MPWRQGSVSSVHNANEKNRHSILSFSGVSAVVRQTDTVPASHSAAATTRPCQTGRVWLSRANFAFRGYSLSPKLYP
jgi:hypothetical protein